MGELKVTTLGIQGFHCSGCADNLGEGLSRIEGMIRAKTDFDRAEVEVRFDPARVTDDDIRDGIRAAGFEPV